MLTIIDKLWLIMVQKILYFKRRTIFLLSIKIVAWLLPSLAFRLVLWMPLKPLSNDNLWSPCSLGNCGCNFIYQFIHFLFMVFKLNTNYPFYELSKDTMPELEKNKEFIVTIEYSRHFNFKNLIDVLHPFNFFSFSVHTISAYVHDAHILYLLTSCSWQLCGNIAKKVRFIYSSYYRQAFQTCCEPFSTICNLYG